eukprot:scaffold194044_cov24-Tisochrysis_lutea.AAC.1
MSLAHTVLSSCRLALCARDACWSGVHPLTISHVVHCTPRSRGRAILMKCSQAFLRERAVATALSFCTLECAAYEG